jgi:ATP-binding cassette, subfamily B, bacterial MsbA
MSLLLLACSPSFMNENPAPSQPTTQPSPAQQLHWAKRLMRLQPFLQGCGSRLALAVAATLLAALTEPMLAALMQPLLDNGFSGKDFPLWWVPLMVIGIFVLRGIAGFTGQYALSDVASRALMQMRESMFNKLLSADWPLYRKESASSLSNTLVYETQTGAQTLVHGLLNLMRDGLALLALLGYLLYLNWKLTLIVAVIFPGVAWIMRTLSKRLYKLTQASQNATDELAYVVEENTLAQRVVRLHGAQEQQRLRFATLSHQLRRLSIRSTIASASSTPLTQVLASVALSAVIVMAVWQSQRDGTTVGGFVAFITAMLMIVAPLRRLSDLASIMTRGLAAVERGLKLLETTPDEPDGTLPVANVQGRIRFEGVTHRYTADAALALDNVSLEVRPGQVVALVGGSGSGKTTLANLVPRFVRQTSGKVWIDDMDVSDCEHDSLRRHIALVSQDVVMFNDSVADNVSLGVDMDEARVWQCLEAARLADTVRALPQGIHTVLGHNANELSGGQRQRLAIARALYKNAPILILDEATSALDNESERAVQAALQVAMQGRTTLVIAHRLSTIERADMIVVMDKGRLVESGTHAQLLLHKGIYAKLHALGFAENI